MPVPQVGHFPFKAGLPFLRVTLSGFSTSFFALHFTQYIVAIIIFTSFSRRSYNEGGLRTSMIGYPSPSP